jgi:Fe-S cluster biogenesis protein NfuA
MNAGHRMHAERTPNPNSLKWILGREIVEGTASVSFESQPAEAVSPLAHWIFQIEGVVGVFFAGNFATISKRDDVEWAEISDLIADILKRQIESGEPVLGSGFDATAEVSTEGLVARICRVLDEKVRPAVVQDGGDIIFSDFRDGVVEVRMRGACSGCPSATATLKGAVESLLREEIPEVREVVAI